MPIIRKCKSRVISINQPLEGIYVLTFESLGKPYRFKPGQFLHLALDEYNPSKAWPDSRCFSIQSSPDVEYIKITFSVKGIFTSRMAKELIVDKEVYLKLAYGDLFQIQHNKKNCVFIAGGTGITPFLSLFNDNSFADYKNAKLYFGIREKAFHIYQKEFDKALSVNSSLKIRIINQATDGIMNIMDILKENSKQASYFLSGPPEMIKTYKKILIKNNIDNIFTDDWE
jgi:predicted ferric reductase